MSVNMYHVSAQGVDERMINVHYYYYSTASWPPSDCGTALHDALDCLTRAAFPV